MKIEEPLETESWEVKMSNASTPTRIRGCQSRSVMNGAGQEDLLEAPNDDAAERQRRQQELLLELQSQHCESPGTPASRRKSMGITPAGLSSTQLAEHYASCIRLSTENKITTKNAFSLHLIDFMREMVKNDDGTTNFQVASCTLDASAKIYAYRVDRIHAETFQIAGELGIASRKKKLSSHVEEGGNAEDAGGGKGTRKTKSRPARTIVHNPKTITLEKLETVKFRDPLLEKICQNRQDGTSAGLILNHIYSLDDSGYLMFNPNTVFVRDLNFKRHDSAPMKLNDFVKENLKKAAATKEPYCPSLSRFLSYEQDSEDPLPDVDVTSTAAFRFNMSTTASGIDQSDSFDNGDFPQEMDTTPGAATIKTCNTEDISKFLAAVPSDYSYFTKQFISAWAGPAHWKVKPLSKTNPPGHEGTRKKAEKGPTHFDFMTATVVNPAIFARSKQSHVLSKRTLSLWRKDKLLLPHNRLRVDGKPFQSLLVCKGHKIMRVLKPATVSDSGVGTYDYNNANDSQNFCPNEPGYEDGGDPCPDDGDHPTGDLPRLSTGGIPDTTSIQTNCTLLGTSIKTELDYVGDNLVKQPYKIPRIKINYCRIPKRFDMKQMKQALWKVVTHGREDKENIDGNDEWASAKPAATVRTSFRGVCRSLPPELNKLNRESVTIPIAFTALLHLATEKNFTLTGVEDLSDVFINV